MECALLDCPLQGGRPLSECPFLCNISILNTAGAILLVHVHNMMMNAKISSDGKFDCQHGEMECTMNTVQACALNYYSNV